MRVLLLHGLVLRLLLIESELNGLRLLMFLLFNLLLIILIIVLIKLFRVYRQRHRTDVLLYLMLVPRIIWLLQVVHLITIVVIVHGVAATSVLDGAVVVEHALAAIVASPIVESTSHVMMPLLGHGWALARL